MHFPRTVLSLTLLAGAVAAAAGAATPTPEAIVDRAVEAAGGTGAFASLGRLHLTATESETTEEGKSLSGGFSADVGAALLRSSRIELPHGVTLARSGDTAWAQVGGKLDDRPQTPRMASGMVNAKLFPVLLPFTLKAKGVALTSVEPVSWDGTPAWQLTVTFERGFFASPLMGEPWTVVISRSDHRVLAAEFHPPADFSQVSAEGVRYRPLKLTKVGGIRLPSQLLVIGVDANGAERGHVRITKLTYEARPADPTLYVNPTRLKALDQGDLSEMPKR